MRWDEERGHPWFAGRKPGMSPFSILVLIPLLILAGCAGTASRRPQAALPADIQQLDRWVAHGRLAVSGPAGGGSGSFDWQQRAANARVQIRGPVGIGSVHLEVHPALKLETADGQTLESDAAWHELESRLGAPVPAGNLRFWMLGLAAPGEHEWRETDADGVTRLLQDGWQIDYQNYSDDPGLKVPMRIRATSGEARVRIVIDRWQLGQ
jgi:outer membrane lipoprotein LolB